MTSDFNAGTVSQAMLQITELTAETPFATYFTFKLLNSI